MLTGRPTLIVGHQQSHSKYRHQLDVTRYQRCTLGRRAYFVTGPTVWNSLPDELTDPNRSNETFR